MWCHNWTTSCSKVVRTMSLLLLLLRPTYLLPKSKTYINIIFFQETNNIMIKWLVSREGHAFCNKLILVIKWYFWFWQQLLNISNSDFLKTKKNLLNRKNNQIQVCFYFGLKRFLFGTNGIFEPWGVFVDFSIWLKA